MIKLQDSLRDFYGRDRNGHVLVPQCDAELIAGRLDHIEGLLERARDLLTVWDCEYVKLFGDIKAALEDKEGKNG